MLTEEQFTKEIYQTSFHHKNALSHAELITEALSLNCLYILSYGNSDRAPVIENGELLLFISYDAAEQLRQARQAEKGNKAGLQVCKIKPDKITQLIHALENPSPQRVRLYGKLPFFIVLPVAAFAVTQAQNKTKNPVLESTNEDLVNKAKEILNMSVASDRQKADPGGRMTKLHYLIWDFLCADKMSPVELDKKLNLPEGFTKQLCNNASSCETPMTIVDKYLAYWGLKEYLYAFKADSIEIAQYLHDSRKIDIYEVKVASVNTGVRYRLESIRRGKDSNGHFVYKAVFTNKEHGQVEAILSDHFRLIVGREYELKGNEEAGQKKTYRKTAPIDAAVTEIAPTMTPEEEREMLEKIHPKPQEVAKQKKNKRKSPSKNNSNTDVPNEALVAEYLANEFEISIAEAQAKTEAITSTAVMTNFAEYIKTGNPGKLQLQGYSFQKLVHAMKFSPYEAFYMLSKLETSPDNALQELKKCEANMLH